MRRYPQMIMADEDVNRAMERVAVVGSSCSGKTTLARQLSRALGSPHTELDAIHWKPGWQERPVDEIRRMAGEAAAGERWVMDGNYSSVRDIVWGRATTVVWLNYPFRVVLWRALSRTTRRVITQEELFSGNREGFRQSFLSRDSIILWAITSYRRVRQDYRRILDGGDFPHLRVIELRGPAEAEALVAALGATSW
ncbi:MAG: adenylate kinase [Chloroflexi bacterium]|nr:adenylate kinase [Chloroflexota bacterium]